MPPAKDMGSEGDSQTELFQWGDTTIADWRRSGYDTTYDTYGDRFSIKRKAMDREWLRKTTPWSTSNNQYGKSVPPPSESRSEQNASVTGSSASISSYRSHPAFNKHSDVQSLSLTEDRPHASVQLEERLRRRSLDAASGDAPLPGSGPDWTLPPLDRSKYLVAQGPIAEWQQKTPTAGNISAQRTEVSESTGRPDVSPLVASQPQLQPPKTGPAKKYMRDTLDRFLRSIPEELRPKTRKQVQPREPPQILKVEHGPRGKAQQAAALPERTTTAISHAVPSRCSSASSSSSGSSLLSGDGVVDLNDSEYDIRKELNRK